MCGATGEAVLGWVSGASGYGDSRAHVPAGLSAVCMPVCVSQRAVIFLGFSLAVGER